MTGNDRTGDDRRTDRQRVGAGETDRDDSSEHTTAGKLDEVVGITIPDEHVGAFVAEVFEDAERSTTWHRVVDALVAPTARDAWDELAAVERTAEVLRSADRFDRHAAELLAGIDVTADALEGDVRETFDEATRLRRNADAFRDGVADAYAEGLLDDEQLVAAVEAVGFDTETIARREDELERVTSAYDFEYRPYGGTLVQGSDKQTAQPGRRGPEAF